MSGVGFEVLARVRGCRARCGVLRTVHGDIHTPAFFFCATRGTLKGLTPLQVRQAGIQGLLANAYHLLLQPGMEVLREVGGLHRFMGWDGPLMTDSGGYQIFAMGYGSVGEEIKRRVWEGEGEKRRRRKTLVSVEEEGAVFRSYVDGRRIFLTPESSMEMQYILGSDLLMQLDECTAYSVDRDYTASSMHRSLRWGKRSLWYLGGLGSEGCGLYGIVQGGIYEDLRRESVEALGEQAFFGTAIGGTLGARKEEMYRVVRETMRYVPEGRPVHLLGIGEIDDILHGVRCGVDTFDCVMPTRLGRHGWALHLGVEKYRVNLRNAFYRRHHDPIDLGCGCYTCGNFSCSYLHHLIKSKEMLGFHLVTLHNVVTMERFMRNIRKDINKTASLPTTHA